MIFISLSLSIFIYLKVFVYLSLFIYIYVDDGSVWEVVAVVENAAERGFSAGKWKWKCLSFCHIKRRESDLDRVVDLEHLRPTPVYSFVLFIIYITYKKFKI